MRITRLIYRARLGYPGAAALPPVEEEALQDLAQSCWVLTLRKLPATCPAELLRNVSAITRFAAPAGVEDILFLGIEEDSPLAALIIWDVVHSAMPGTRFTFHDSIVGERYLDRPYFRSGLERLENGHGATYRKQARLPAEEGSLDSWTFGIPTGPEDATILNACVARILELKIPNKEILLCGRPSANFKYWDQVRIVGEDITAPPIQICRKKNRLVEEARFENICLIHDRVFLPSDFDVAVARFGNSFPFTTMQSFYFDDRWNFVCRRYSDFGVGLRLSQHVFRALARDDIPTPHRYAPGIFSKVERTGFVYANAHRHSSNNYPTGSLYLVKKAVWQLCPQDERLRWIEFEDIEQGERAAALGIPSRINPFGFTQSMISRPILSFLGYSTCEKLNGNERQFRSNFEKLSFLPRKPLLRKTQAQAIKDYDAFLAKWGITAASAIEPTTSATTTTRRRLRWMVQAASSAHFPLHRSTISKFLKDFEKMVVCEQVPYEWHESVAAEFVHGPDMGMRRFFETCYEIFNHSAQRPRKQIFTQSLLDYMPNSSVMVFFGSLASAVGLAGNRHQFVFVGGFLTRLRAIMRSTPFARYATGERDPHA